LTTSNSARRRGSGSVRSSPAGILVLASHDIELIQSACNRAILLEQARIVAAGATDTIPAQYLAGSGARTS